jgi:hypothetical protein
MATDHRGITVGNPDTDHGGHRPTPRVNKALQNYYKIDEGTAQSVIDEHRSGNDYLGDEYYGIDYPYEASVQGSKYNPYEHGHPDDDNIGSRIDNIPSAINSAIDARSGKDSGGYGSPYSYPPTVKVKDMDY